MRCMRDEKRQPDHTDVCLWLDFYGPLLTERTRDILGLYFDCDLSLAEIAQNLQISRQAVHDKVRQGVKSLAEYEAKMGLARRHESIRRILDEMKQTMEQSDKDTLYQQLTELEDLL